MPATSRLFAFSQVYLVKSGRELEIKACEKFTQA